MSSNLFQTTESSTPLNVPMLQDLTSKKKRKCNNIRETVLENKISSARTANADEIIREFPVIQHSSNVDGTACQFCNLSLSDFKALNIHKRQKHPETYFACPNIEHCENPAGEQTMFEGVREMVSHYMQKHEKQVDGNIVCAVPNCGQSYTNRNGLNKHLIKHHDEEQLRLLAANFYLKENSSHIHHRIPRWKK